MFAAMLGAPFARRHEGHRRRPQAGHDHHVLLFISFCGTAFEDETIHAGKLVSITAINTLGAATVGVCFLLFSVLVLKRFRKKKMDVVLAIDISVPILLLLLGSARGYFGRLSSFR